PEPGARPALAHPHPARAIVVALPLPIPWELDAHAPKLVDVDLLSRGADHGRALDPSSLRLGQGPRRRIGGLCGHSLAGHGPLALDRALDLEFGDQESLTRRELRVGVMVDGEDRPWLEAKDVGRERDLALAGALGGQGPRSQRLASGGVVAREPLVVSHRPAAPSPRPRDASARVIMVLLITYLESALPGRIGEQREAGVAEVVITDREGAGANAVREHDFADELLLRSLVGLIHVRDRRCVVRLAGGQVVPEREHRAGLLG